MNWRNLIGGLFLISLYACTPGLAGRTDLPLTQATPSGDVKVTYDKDKISYWSSKYGISFLVPSHLRIWARELATQKNPLGEESQFNIRGRSRILDIKDTYEQRYNIWLRFHESQHTEAEIKEWIAQRIGRFRDAQEYGMPERSNETKVVIGGVKVTKADYIWRSGAASLTATFKTSKGTYFFYARPRASYNDLEALLKTLKFVGK